LQTSKEKASLMAGLGVQSCINQSNIPGNSRRPRPFDHKAKVTKISLK
jgi:hypothetical protein